MLDSWGDGWNGASLDVIVNGVVVLSGLPWKQDHMLTYNFQYQLGTLLQLHGLQDLMILRLHIISTIQQEICSCRGKS